MIIALDIGGTAMKGALVDPDGTLLHTESRPTDRSAPVPAIRAFARDLAERAGPGGATAVGLAVPGLVEPDVARYSATFGWRDVPAAAFCDLDLPVSLGHDVTAAGLAEARSAPERDFLLLPIGTSIAGALILGGRPYATPLTGQIGHAPVHPGGRPCPCGGRGCLAAYSSASAIAEHTGTADAAAAARLVAAGDPRAVAVWAAAVEALSLALTTYTLLLDPAAIVIAGGLSACGDLLLDPLRAALAERLVFRAAPAVRVSSLGLDTGVLGAALLTGRVAGRG